MQKLMSSFAMLVLCFLFIFFSVNLTDSGERNSIDKSPAKSSLNSAAYLPGAVIVKFKAATQAAYNFEQTIVSGLTSIDSKVQHFGIDQVERVFNPPAKLINPRLPDLSKIYRLQFSGSFDAKDVAAAFAKDPAVEYAEPIFIQQIYADPNDKLYPAQWYLRSVRADSGWDVEKGDSTVIIGIIDSGVDTDHPDLVDKIWINTDEIPGNRVDDDGNGFVDDVNGWDFEKGNADPNPDPDGVDNDGDGLRDDGVDHGTSMAGLAAAATDNAEGIAGMGWKCSIMPIKSLGDEGSGSVDQIARGIYYAANNGAHVINLSLGGSDPSRVQQDAVEYAYKKGVVIVAAAGNQSSNNFRYPGAFKYVVAVGATGSNADLKSSISNFGIYVDVLAPGGDFNLSPPSEMISTVYYNPTYGFNNYYRARTKEGYLTAGTSSSTAMVSGLMGLVISQHRNWSNEQVIRQVILTADNVDHLNPGFEDQLGSGRINAYRALTETNPAEVAPRIVLTGDVSISDSLGGDNDNIFERGETAQVTVTSYRNFSVSPARNTIFTLTTDDSDLTIINGTYNYGYFAPDTSIIIPGLFSFSVNPNAKGRTARLFVGWQADGGYRDADTFAVIIGKIPILVVDDDSDADDDDFPLADKFYTNILDNFKLNYAVWDRFNMGPLGPDQLSNFPIVIWLCAWAFPSLDSTDQLAIANFLDKGGNLFVTGQDIGWDFNDPAGYGYLQRDFYAKYLHATYYADDSDVNEVVGLPNDPIGDGLHFKAWQPGLAATNQFPDEIEPNTGATAVFEYAGGKNHKFGIKYKGDHKVVYFGMGLEAIDSEEGTSANNISPIRTEVLDRILNWLNFIDHQPLFDTENINAPRTITAQIAASIGESDLVGMELYWRKQGGTEFNKIKMTPQGNYNYRGEIPGPGEVTTIEYYLKMVDTYYEWNAPKEAPGKIYHYFVGPDQSGPTFSHVSIKSSINGEEAWPLLVGVKDNSGLDTSSVFIHYESKSMVDSVRLFAKDSPDQFRGELRPVFVYGDTVEYYFSAYDKANKPNRGRSQVFSFVVGYENFESGLVHWSTSPSGWGLDDTPTFARSGVYSINDSPKEPYPPNRDVSIVTNFGIDLSQTSHAALKFWTRLFLEINHDFGYIEVSTDGGATWNQVGLPLNGFIATWKQQTISLSQFCGSGNTDVRIRFRMTSDATQVGPFQGWFIDDVQIIEGLNVTEVSEAIQTALPERFSLYQNYPNPFNPNTTIQFDLPQPGRVALNIFNIKGELVRTLVHDEMNAGTYKMKWDGKDDEGRSLSSGIYLYKLSTKDFNETRKLLLLK